MIKILKTNDNNISISEFYENDCSHKYNYDAIYQRDKVWSEETKSFLIDSILKNYPIPPIFLRLKIDEATGKSTYDVIDGKQRLTTIRDFIDGNVSLPDDFGGDSIGDPCLDGANFKDLDKYPQYKSQLWKYRIPVIFLESEEEDLVRNVFDRLNRNGVPLVPQELRKAQYGQSQFYNAIEVCTKESAWTNIIEAVLEKDRMEDKEFVSELMLLLHENRVLDYTKETLDELYEKYKNSSAEDWIDEFKKVSDFAKNIQLDFLGLNIKKVSHMYAIWGICALACQQNVDSQKLTDILNEFYSVYNKKGTKEGVFAEYKYSMSANTKGRSSRIRRIKALLEYCKSRELVIQYTFA